MDKEDVVYIYTKSLFFNLFIYFNWELITLQYCGFCHTLTWISHVYMYPPILKPSPTSPWTHPSGLSLSTGFECPDSCIELGLVIYSTYGNCSARSPSPQSGKKTPRNNATCNRGIYYWLKPGPPTLTKGVRMKGPEPQFSRVFIGYNY